MSLREVKHVGTINPELVSSVSLLNGFRLNGRARRKWWLWGKFVRSRGVADNAWVPPSVRVCVSGREWKLIECKSNSEARRVWREIKDDVRGIDTR